ncbi:PAS domain S-box protein [Spirulina subsalsa FACHB-351]|uniref:histidine kinase n=1 Tax=Spirulina subsalsa FACHB-351 TaxID=234711 RepID=A0ABT3L702_9CYAN|nr:ATP-binding protein [Spirulina subsalsa]MCW6037280.1 PAS domain S-box protein [Spirulina subsalsa FACHB-351]
MFIDNEQPLFGNQTLERVTSSCHSPPTNSPDLPQIAKLEQALSKTIQKNCKLEQQYSSLFNNINVGIFRTTPDGKLLEANPALARIYGYASPEHLLDCLTDVQTQLYVNPEKRQEFVELMYLQGYVRDFEVQVYHYSGEVIWISENAEVVRDTAGNICFYEGFVIDITERKRTELALKQSERRYKAQTEQLKRTLTQLHQTQSLLVQSEKLSSLGQLVAGVAHEINNPVNFVYGNLNPALEYASDLIGLLQLYQQYYPEPHPEIAEESEAIDIEFLMEDFPKTLTSMQVGTERIRQIVQSLRNFSRLDDEVMKPTDIHQGLDSTLMILKPRLKAKHDHPEIIVIQDYGQLPGDIICFSGLLNQVFMNLLGNAIDALDEAQLKGHFTGDKSPTIHIQTLTEGNEVVIRIADNAMGMSPQVKNRIFDTFFTTKPTGKGTGLGLSISYDIITQKHQGSLTCSSTMGEGSEFVIKLPLNQ